MLEGDKGSMKERKSDRKMVTGKKGVLWKEKGRREGGREDRI